ncbi:hypothetical protein F7725_024377 [Dissostichus mawsoni]|uniref:Uncharacterized protein n=1 Tax=Dissostichus mawsoni TaxID=36200 RepID=A0A7J5XZ87_DISMA|nr:hypothetical protein F7725_024377 [Dissostichus mawsoni]
MGGRSYPEGPVRNVHCGGVLCRPSGYTILRGGGSSMDAVVEAVSILENNPCFNAGCGSVLNIKGEVEMDAIVMDGLTLGSGAVSAVRNIANPIQLARLVMDKVSPESLITEYSRMRWAKNLAPGANPVESQIDVYLIFDKYYDYSIKSVTRDVRETVVNRKHHPLLSTKLPAQKVVLSSLKTRNGSTYYYLRN